MSTINCYNDIKINKEKLTEYKVPVGMSADVLALLRRTFNVLGQAGNAQTRLDCETVYARIETHMVEVDDYRPNISIDRVEEEPVVGNCVATDAIDGDLPVLSGQKARHEIRSVVIGEHSDIVKTSMGEVDLGKNMGVIRTPVSNILVPVVVPFVEDSSREIMRVRFPSDCCDAELVSAVFSSDYDASLRGGRKNPPEKHPLDWFLGRKGVLDTSCDLLEYEYPKYREAKDVTDAYYHPLDPGRWSRSDHEMNVRDLALKRLVKKFTINGVKPRLGIITSNDEHFVRIAKIFGKDRVFYPALEVAVDLVLFHPYEKALTFDPGVDPAELMKMKLAKHAPAWENVINWIFPINNVRFEVSNSCSKNYGLFSIALHRPRFFITSLPVTNLQTPDAILPQTKRRLKSEVYKKVYFKNARFIASMLAISAYRNHQITPFNDKVVLIEWELRGGKMSPAVILGTRVYLGRETFITGRRKIGTSRGVVDNDTALMLEIQKIADAYGSSWFTKESLSSLDIDSQLLQRLIMRGYVVPAKRQGQVYYGLVQASTTISWELPSYPPAYLFADGQMVCPADHIITNILPVPLTMKQLLSVAIKKLDTVPLRRRVYSGGGESGHIVKKKIDDVVVLDDPGGDISLTTADSYNL